MWWERQSHDRLAGGEHWLSLPHPEANEDDWERYMPMSELPPLPTRTCGFFTEPFFGITVVSLICFMFIGMTMSMGPPTTGSRSVDEGGGDLVTMTQKLIWLWASVAGACVLYLLLGPNGEISRSRRTCYPVPDQVAVRLRKGELAQDLRNVPAMDGRSYCVRCYLWRPEGASHHCGTCQRCVTGFDHHCGVFGRCITEKNMPCFYTLIGMFFFGAVTAVVAGASGAPSTVDSGYQ